MIIPQNSTTKLKNPGPAFLDIYMFIKHVKKINYNRYKKYLVE